MWKLTNTQKDQNWKNLKKLNCIFLVCFSYYLFLKCLAKSKETSSAGFQGKENVQNDGGLLFLLANTVLILSLIIVIMEKEQIIKKLINIKNRFTSLK